MKVKLLRQFRVQSGETILQIGKRKRHRENQMFFKRLRLAVWSEVKLDYFAKSDVEEIQNPLKINSIESIKAAYMPAATME